MKQIWEFPLETTDVQRIEMPVGAEILTIQTQNEVPCIWALVDTGTSVLKCKRTFNIFRTGHNIPELVDSHRKYIGTYQLNNGGLVFHCFELLGLIS